MQTTIITSLANRSYSVRLSHAIGDGIWDEICETVRDEFDRSAEDDEIDLVEAGEDDLCDVITVRGKPVAEMVTVQGFGGKK